MNETFTERQIITEKEQQLMELELLGNIAVVSRLQFYKEMNDSIKSCTQNSRDSAETA